SNIPSIRFKEFTHAWEQDVLGNLFDSYGGTSLENYFNNHSNYKVINIGSFSEDFKYRDQNIRIELTEKTNKFLLKQGDLAMILNDKTQEGKIIGSCLRIQENNTFIYNQRTQKLSPKNKIIESNFSYFLLNNKKNRNKIFKSSQGNTQIYINWSDIKNIKYLIPNSLKEQEKISSLFDNLEEILSLHKHKF
ncbi:restriction endonuclease subunit S, partial [Mycoplasma sp. CB776]